MRRPTAPSGGRKTRLAPSPTGALHLGNARTFVLNWVLARQQGWRVALRIEDLDTPRVKPETVTQTIDTLAWLGLDWDEGPTTQAADLAPYRAALERLRQDGSVYPCRCTRQEIERAQSAPHAEDHELRYPGTCRHQPHQAVASQIPGDAAAWRMVVPPGPVAFHDHLHGPQTIDVDAQVGDFIVATKAGLPAYQLAVVVDDARQAITDVVRGDDLLGSAARQVLLYRALGLGGPPAYYHLPLVLGTDGRRLAKRHGDTRVATYRDRGVPPERVLGLIAYWSGMTGHRGAVDLGALVAGWALDRLPRAPVTFTAEDDAWLRDG